MQLDHRGGTVPFCWTAGVTLTIDNENCLTGAGTLGAGGSYQILNPMPVFTPATLVYTGGDLSEAYRLQRPPVQCP